MLAVFVSCKYIMQVTNNSNASSFVITSTDTNATLDNGVYSCQVTLTISGVDSFSIASNNSVVLFKGTYTTLYQCYYYTIVIK